MNLPWYFLAIAFVSVIAIGCCPKRQILKVETVRFGCLRVVGPQPEIPDVLGTDDHTTDPDCHEKFELCALPVPAGRIERYVREAQRWMKQATIACEEESDEDEDADRSDSGSLPGDPSPGPADP